MYSNREAPNSTYPTQWALNPTAYQNVDSNSVDWAALAQQWIAMKDAAAVMAVPPPAPPAKLEVEEGEAPMEVENIDINDSSMPPDWNSSSNSWNSGWNQWGWAWSGNGQMDPKIPDPTITGMPPLMDGFIPPDGNAQMPGYTTGTAAPTFQHGYWTAPQADQAPASGPRSTSRTRDNRRSKSKNRDQRPSRPNRSNRERPAPLPVAPPLMGQSIPLTIDAAKRRQLPAWIREGLEKMEREKQRVIEREQELIALEAAEKEKKRIEEEELLRMKAEASGEAVLPPKSKFESDSESEEMEKVDPDPVPQEDIPEPSDEELALRGEENAPPLVKKSKDEIMQEIMLAVRTSLTEILLEVTDQEIHMVSQEEFNRYTAAQASRLNAMKASKSKALAAIATNLGLGAYESSSDEAEDEELNEVSDQQLQDIIRRRRQDFERVARDIEAEVRKAEAKEAAEEPTTPIGTPEPPRITSRASETPPPTEAETPEKISDSRPPRDKKFNHRTTDQVDGAGAKKMPTIHEERPKKSKKECTPSPDQSNHKDFTTSDSEEDSQESSSATSPEPEAKIEKKKRKRRSSSTDSLKKKKDKRKKTHKEERSSKYDERETSKFRRKDDYDRHRSRHKERDRYRDNSEERPKKRVRRSRSASYDRRRSRDRSDDRRAEKRSYSRRDRSYERRERSHERHDRSHERRDRSHERRDRSYERHDKYDRYERARDHERRRTRSGSRGHRR